jgi:biotin operon repressor
MQRRNGSDGVINCGHFSLLLAECNRMFPQQQSVVNSSQAALKMSPAIPLKPDQVAKASQNQLLIARIQRQRDAICNHLPIYDSLIGYCLFLLLCQCELKQEALCQKDIQIELGHSQGAVRKLIKMLASDGWIEITKSDGDQRGRYVMSTPRMKREIAKFVQTIFADA